MPSTLNGFLEKLCCTKSDSKVFYGDKIAFDSSCHFGRVVLMLNFNNNLCELLKTSSRCKFAETETPKINIKQYILHKCKPTMYITI